MFFLWVDLLPTHPRTDVVPTTNYIYNINIVKRLSVLFPNHITNHRAILFPWRLDFNVCENVSCSSRLGEIQNAPLPRRDFRRPVDAAGGGGLGRRWRNPRIIPGSTISTVLVKHEPDPSCYSSLKPWHLLNCIRIYIYYIYIYKIKIIYIYISYIIYILYFIYYIYFI